MKNVDLIIFDFDGTLVNSGEDLVASVNFTLELLHLSKLEKSEIINFIGDGVYKLVEGSLGAEHQNHFAKAIKIFTAHYREHMFDTTKPYPGVKDVLNHFNEKIKIIVTNKRHDYTLKIAEHLNIDGYFEEIIGSDGSDLKKPDARILRPVLKKYNVPKSRVIIVGDGVNDILLAKNTGVMSCAFLGGLTAREALIDLKPDYQCETLLDMINLFQ